MSYMSPRGKNWTGKANLYQNLRNANQRNSAEMHLTQDLGYPPPQPPSLVNFHLNLGQRGKSLVRKPGPREVIEIVVGAILAKPGSLNLSLRPGSEQKSLVSGVGCGV